MNSIMHCIPAHTTYLGKQHLLISRVAESEPVFLSWAGPQFEGSSFTQKVIKNRKMFWTYSRKPRVTKYNPRYVAAGISCIQDLRRGDKLLLYPNIQLTCCIDHSVVTSSAIIFAGIGNIFWGCAIFCLSMHKIMLINTVRSTVYEVAW